MKKPIAPPAQIDPTRFPRYEDALKRFLSNPLAIRRVAEWNKDYPHWEKFKRRVEATGENPELLWHLTQLQRQLYAKPVILTSDHDFRFIYNLTSAMDQTLHQFDLNMGGIIGGATTIPEGTKDQVLVSSLMEEAIASSMLEGAATTREVAKRMLREERKPRDQSEQMVMNNYLTMQRLVEWANKEVTPELLLELHRTMVADTMDDPDNAGRFRLNDEVMVMDHEGEILHIPPSHTRLNNLIKAVCDFANAKDEDPFMHPVIKGVILHFLIGYIHPFVDGNGRTARALFYWHLLRNGYWLVEYLAISRIILRAPAKYGRAYLHTEQDHNDLTYFLAFNLHSLGLAMKDLDKFLAHKMDERKKLFHVVKEAPVNDRQADLIALWLREPEAILTIQGVKNRFRVVYQTARTDLMGLEELGLATHRRTGRTLNYYRTPDFEAMLNRHWRSRG